MSLLLQIALVLTTLTFIVEASNTATKEGAQEFLTNLEKGFDENKDGTVTDAEIVQGFQYFDENKDGKMDKAEFKKYLQRDNKKFISKADFLFRIFDVDSTGFIEMENELLLVKELDQNGDGLVDDAEFDR